MAYNEISIPTWQNLVRRVFGLTGGGGNVPLLAPEIQPVAIIQGDSPDFALHRGERTFAGAVSRQGDPATTARISLTNPDGSGKLCILERIIVWGDAGAELQFGVTSPPVVFANQAFLGPARDLRFNDAWPQCYPAALAMSHESSAAAWSFQCTIASAVRSQMTPIELRNFILPPNSSFGVRATIPDIDIALYLEWKEKVFERAEEKP